VHSSSNMTDDDLKAIAVYLKSLAPQQEAFRRRSPLSDPRHRWRAGDLQGQLRWHATRIAGEREPRACSRGWLESHTVQSDDPTHAHSCCARERGAWRRNPHIAPTHARDASFDWRLGRTPQVASVADLHSQLLGQTLPP